MLSPCCSAQNGKDDEDSEGVVLDVLSHQENSWPTYTVGIILYGDYVYGNLYQMPILYVEIDI